MNAKIENRIVIAPVGAVSMRITWIQVSNFMGKVEEVTRFLFPTNELNEKPESRMVAVETGLEKAKADLIAAATGEQNTLLSAAVVEGEAVEFTYTANRCINEKAGEVVPLSSENTAFRVSEPIPVSPGELYAFTVSGGWSKYLYAFYDENDKVVGGFQQKTDMIRTYYDRISPVPATAATVRIAWVENNHFTGVIKKVTRISYPSAELVGTAAEQAAERDSRISGLENYLASKIVDENYEYAIGETVKVTENNGMLLNPTTGAIVKEPTGNTNYRLSEPITVEPYTPYCISAAGKAGYGLYAFYDVNGNRVGGENNTGNTDRKIENKVVTSPARAVSIRVACINGMQSCGIQPMTRGYFIGMKPKWYGRTWVCLGDSLTESNTFNTACIAGLEDVVYVNIMFNSDLKRLVVKGCNENDRDALRWCIAKPDKRKSRKMSCRLFSELLYKEMDWSGDCRYKILGYRIEFEGEALYVFDLVAAEVFHECKKKQSADQQPTTVAEENTEEQPVNPRKGYYPDDIAGTFGMPVEQHRQESELRQMDGFVSVGMLTGMPGQQQNL